MFKSPVSMATAAIVAALRDITERMGTDQFPAMLEGLSDEDKKETQVLMIAIVDAHTVLKAKVEIQVADCEAIQKPETED